MLLASRSAGREGDRACRASHALSTQALYTGNGARAHPVHSIAACRHLAKRCLGPSGSDGALDVTCRIGKVAAQFENGDLPIDPQEEVRFVIQT